VLGTRTGNERPPLQRQREATAKAAKPVEDGNVTQLRTRAAAEPSEDAARQARKFNSEVELLSAGNAEVASGLKGIAELDPGFSPKSFMEGAKAAYEMIVTAFAGGDRQTLRNLLDKEVFDGFERAIKDREAADRKVDFTFVGLPKVEISAAEADKRQVSITLRFHAEVVSATRDKDGAIVEGNAEQVTGIADEWTFARNPKSRDPNWKLVATSQLE
jgi:predicted lipid-binding transport protein (Tim44 family)